MYQIGKICPLCASEEELEGVVIIRERGEGIMTESEALMILLKFSSEDIAKGRVISASEFRDRLSQRREKITLCTEDALVFVDALENEKHLSEEVVARWKEMGKRYKKIIK